MRLLKRRKGAAFDPAMGDPDLQQAIDRLADGDWHFVQDLAGSRPDRWLMSSVLNSDHASIPLSRFEEWADASGRAIAMSFLGQAQVRAAWAERGRAPLHSVSDDTLSRFRADLERAETTLREAADMDPRSSEPWVGLMVTARGLELPKRELESRFVEVHAREPFRPDACHHMLQSLSAKWMGSHEEMFEFAEFIRQEAPRDSPSLGVVAMAHFEYAMSGWEHVTLAEYLRRSEVAEEILASVRPLLEAINGPAPTEYVSALNLFLLMIEPTDALSGRAVRETITRVADRASLIPWSYFGPDIDHRFARIRDERAKAAKRL